MNVTSSFAVSIVSDSNLQFFVVCRSESSISLQLKIPESLHHTGSIYLQDYRPRLLAWTLLYFFPFFFLLLYYIFIFYSTKVGWGGGKSPQPLPLRSP